jgi:hypothetical protein
MPASVVQFPGEHTGELDPDDVLHSCAGRFKQVLVLGIDKDDDLFYLLTSTCHTPDMLWLVEMARHDLMRSATRGNQDEPT